MSVHDVLCPYYNAQDNISYLNWAHYYINDYCWVVH